MGEHTSDATRCKVCGGPFSAKRVIIDGCAYHERCSCMSYPSHTHEDYSRLSDMLSTTLGALEDLQSAETTYRMTYDLDGYHHQNTLEARSRLRATGHRARGLLASVGSSLATSEPKPR